MEHKINIEFNEKFNFYKLTCSEGCYMTDWNEGDDILEFASAIIICCPADTDITKYHCISVEENDRLQALRDEAEENREEITTPNIEVIDSAATITSAATIISGTTIE